MALVSVSLYAFGRTGKDTPGKYRDRLNGLRYMNVSAGAGVWSESLQSGMEHRMIPFSAISEYGRTSLPYAFFAGTIFRNTYSQERFLLNPNCFFAGMEYLPLQKNKISEKLNVYCMGGVNLCYTRFTEEIYPGIINYENKVERKTKPGLMAGLGVGYRLGSIEVRPSLFWFNGEAGFLAGHFGEQKFSTGSVQAHLMISYRFVFDRNNRSCPVYFKFNGK